MKKEVFVIGTKGIPANYGGFETFVENLVSRKELPNISYHVSCMNNNEVHFNYNDTDCFNVRVPFPGGPLGRMLHVSRALRQTEKSIAENNYTQPIVYVLGCRIGPFFKRHVTRLHDLGAIVFVNPDGLEWARSKWSWWQQKFLRYCEKCLVCSSDLAICDSKAIESYVRETYGEKIATTYISYGSEVTSTSTNTNEFEKWANGNAIQEYGYYLVVGRFVPENNYECIIQEFIKSDSKKDLVIVSDATGPFLTKLQKSTNLMSDRRIKLVGTIYEKNLIKQIREKAFAYIHGHSVGGTNPSLLEALGSTNLNLLYDVAFNYEVARDSALYWSGDTGSLARLIAKTENMTEEEIAQWGLRAKSEVNVRYRWRDVVLKHEQLFEFWQ